ncbi:fibroin heavy chain-like [Brienomyrus brachyistius]|uniref:fibroin heavy chain-like n=1 Tax=Brienomyrus brachyistius TaxID=42636 RepID=UPI0020B20422|nr:fibroin heavy chain-like [Brienomyrus brachyistius]
MENKLGYLRPDLTTRRKLAYQPNLSREDGISSAVHLSLAHLEDKNIHVRMLFVDFSSAFNTIIPQQLVSKLYPLAISTPVCNWLLGYLTARPQEEVKQLVGWCRDNNLILNVEKTKEMIIGFRRNQPSHSALVIDNSVVEVVSSIKFLGASAALGMQGSAGYMGNPVKAAGGYGGLGRGAIQQGYGAKPAYTGAAFGLGTGRGLALGPQAGRQGPGYGSTGYGYKGNPLGGYGPGAGVFPRPGLGLGAGLGAAFGRKGLNPSYGAAARYPSGGTKAGYAAAGGVSDRQGARPTGYGAGVGYHSGAKAAKPGYGAAAGVSSGLGVTPFGYGAGAGYPNAAARTANAGYGAAVPRVQGSKPTGSGAVSGYPSVGGVKGYGAVAGVPSGQGVKPTGYGAAAGYPNKGGLKVARPGYGAVAGYPNIGAKTAKPGYGTKAGLPKGEVPESANTGYGPGTGSYLGMALGNGYGAGAIAGYGKGQGAYLGMGLGTGYGNGKHPTPSS